MTAFLESGAALIVGLIGPDGRPFATRGWGLTVLSRDDATVRLLLDAGNLDAIADRSQTEAIAVTATNVHTLRSIQLKGHTVQIDSGTDADRERARQYCEEFFGEVHATDGTSRSLLDRLAPADYIACIIDCDESFDQTPGPAAGAPIGAPEP